MENDHDHEGVYDIGQPQPPMKAVTAFLVVCMPDGTKTAYNDVNIPLELERAPTLNDMYDGAGQVQRDVEVMITTQQVVQNMVNAQMQLAQQAMQAQQDQKLVDQVMGPNGMPLNRQQRRHG